MTTFLEQVAQELYAEYGDQISNLKMVFPSRRAGLFFGRALSGLIHRPMWQPTYHTINELMHSRSELHTVDQLRLLTELYLIYNDYHKDSFDKFYNFGQLLVADFDTIDKYMIEASKLYANLSELQDIDAQFATDNQDRELIVQFWRTFNQRRTEYTFQQTFLKLWQQLGPIYLRFKTRLREQGIGYEGMIYRDAVENIEDTEVDGTYCFVGFNALNECEKRLFKYFQATGHGRFFWDADLYYTQQEQQEAGLFIRRNMELLGGEKVGMVDLLGQPKKVDVYACPSDVMQCQALHRILEQISLEQGGAVGIETAIVLTNERLLPLAIRALPTVVDKVNVTMGYPITSTTPYVMLEHLIALQKNRQHGLYYYKDTLWLLGHTYVKQIATEAQLTQEIIQKQSVYIEAEYLALGGPKIAKIFRTDTINSPQEMASYLVECLCDFAPQVTESFEDKSRQEYLSITVDAIRRLMLLVKGCGIEISLGVFLTSLRSSLSSLRVPYSGEPLGGLQIMGILETRNLDFRNVIILSMDDENFPAAHLSKSYIPQNLRQGYHLPGDSEHLAVYSYYFFRLMQRAQRVSMLYSNSCSAGKTGEASRYISQLRYEWPHPIEWHNVELAVKQQTALRAISIDKSSMVMDNLRKRSFSPSAINCYIDCSLKFYYQYIAELKGAIEEFQEDISSQKSGTILHNSLAELYATIKSSKQIVKLIDKAELIDTVLDRQIEKAIDSRILGQAIQGKRSYMRSMVREYLLRILSFDAAAQPFSIEGIEQEVMAKITTTEGISVTIKGSADRVDGLSSGVVRIVDYKSGGDKMIFDSLEALFTDTNLLTDKYAPHNSAALQTLIYAWAFTQQSGRRTLPAIYAVCGMTTEDYSPYLVEKNSGPILELTPEIIDSLQKLLCGLFEEMFSDETPFTQTCYTQKCQWCPYNKICGR
ncbi:MAG: PD-(D/E)XK nuclease family protein [Mucinivorans sp.]